jgi:hypothetical protein
MKQKWLHPNTLAPVTILWLLCTDLYRRLDFVQGMPLLLSWCAGWNRLDLVMETASFAEPIFQQLLDRFRHYRGRETRSNRQRGTLSLELGVGAGQPRREDNSGSVHRRGPLRTGATGGSPPVFCGVHGAVHVEVIHSDALTE